MVPVRNREWEAAESGEVRVLVPRYGLGRIGGWFNKRATRPHIKVKLDDVGSAVWRTCDGQSTVAEIARRLESDFGEKVSPLHERLSRFFLELERSRFIRWHE